MEGFERRCGRVHRCSCHKSKDEFCDWIEEKAAPAGAASWVNGQRWGEIIAFVGFVGGYNVPPFYIDRFEVTNRQFQDFIDKGGYERHEY